MDSSSVDDNSVSNNGNASLKRNASFELLRVSNPPTGDELDRYEDLSPANLPAAPKRELLKRVFANRPLRLDKIRWVGFDMDYTLATYISPAYEILSYNLLVDRLIQMGYPKSLKQKLEYDPEFPIRGLLLDKELGYLIKIDLHQNVVQCVHGRQKISKKVASELYPSLYIPPDEIGPARRFWPMDTLFSLPEICLWGDLVEFLKQENNETGLCLCPSEIEQPSKISYMNLFQDLRAAMDHVHLKGDLKAKTLENMDKYIKKTPETAILFDRLRKAGKQILLLTNSEYFYTHKVMDYLFGGQLLEYPSWRDYFDVIIVGARKPSFFQEGTTLREVNLESGNLHIGVIEEFVKGKVYQGGSISVFNNITGTKGNQMLYIGDHIYADILSSKKSHAWRTMLVVPELEHELKVLSQNVSTMNHLANLEFMRAAALLGDSSETECPDITALRQHIKQTVEQISNTYNKNFGSLFRANSRHSHFAGQVLRYSDLYTYDFLNLLNYPLWYHFAPRFNPLPHEYPSY